MPIRLYDIGDRPVITATFADITGGVAVATTVTFIVRDPAGVETSYPTGHANVTNPSSNVWKLTLNTLTLAGRYVVRAKSTAALVTAEEVAFTVRTSAFVAP